MAGSVPVAVVVAVSAVVLAVPAAAAEPTPTPADSAVTDTRPPQGALTIDVEIITGSGCPAGTAAVVVDPDNRYFRVVYSNYLAEIGPEVPPTLSRRNCQISLNPGYPLGEYTFAVDQVWHEGWVVLAQGTSSRFRASEFYAGASAAEPGDLRLVGPLGDGWNVADDREEAWLVWRPCGAVRYLNLSSQIIVQRGSGAADAESLMTLDESRYRLAWERCPGAVTPAPTSTPVPTPAPVPTSVPALS